MDFEWIAIALGDVAWLAAAFVFGLLSRIAGLPPLVGFLATGFVLNLLGVAGGEMLQKLSDLGITLLLFTIGLKLNLQTLVRPQVWAVTGLHMSVVVLVLGTAIYALALAAAPFFDGLDLSRSLLIALALSFSSTVFAAKVLEDRGETNSLHGRVAVGILVAQDLVAVVFLALSAGSWPTAWAPLVLLLIPLRRVLARVLDIVGHGELMALYGFVLALGGAEIFELVGLKSDMGALVLGVLIAGHAKSDEMTKAMLGFKDLFLLGFFLMIGLSGQLTWDAVLVGAALTPLVFLKAALFLGLMIGFKLRARTSLLAALNLNTFSEFGLIVAAFGVANDWIDGRWLIVIAVALALSCALSAGLNIFVDRIYARHRSAWQRLQRSARLADDRLLDMGGVAIAIIGMGRVGTGAYDELVQLHGRSVVGVDIDPATVRNHLSMGRNVLLGDPSDGDFWDRVHAADNLELVMLALPKLASSLAALNQLKAASSDVPVAATARFEDEVESLQRAGTSEVFNIYAEAGSGFATHATARPTVRQ